MYVSVCVCVVLYRFKFDESSLGILRCTFLVAKCNHLYLGTGCVWFFLGGKGGGTPLRHGHKERYTDLKLKNSTS